ncbi:hypothetical protein [Bacillus sp. V2I10]|uniref:hypothetical protein n=1 Tax=Bacillus sp. V2I10 TaxID=3042276 RepID=UPI00277DEDC2|nr:hypothetical protein [Bacillus sp. V2I10]MDQ0861940.1 hypothetical protein [Bacillus sp. V2I10]
MRFAKMKIKRNLKPRSLKRERAFFVYYIDWDELSDLIQEAYLRAAPKRLVKKWNELQKK